MISIIIPTYNEEGFLLQLIESIKHQDFQDYEIIVADNNSFDRTKEIAKEHGAKVVEGGKPSIARNRGASHARGSILLFLDADVVLPDGFLGHLYNLYQIENVDVCIPSRIPVERRSIICRALFAVTNIYFKLMTMVKPLGLGNCILINKTIHEAIGGFDEHIGFGEDYDYINRAAKVGKFKVFLSIHCCVSIRRIAGDGIAKSVVRSLFSDLHFIFTGRSLEVFGYEFGDFTKKDSVCR